MQKNSAQEASIAAATSSSSSDSSSDSSESTSYDSYDSSCSSDGEAAPQKKTQEKSKFSRQPRESHESIKTGDPCYEDFMPGKDSDRSVVPPPPQAAPEPEKSEDKNLTKEDLIDILSEALYRSAQKEKTGQRQKRESSEEGEEDVEEANANQENQKVLGAVASSVLSKKEKGRSSPSARTVTSRKPSRPSATRTGHLGWKKKIEAIKKAHLQLSNRVAALIELAE